ncbi:MAG: GDSL-type esterase/lipase family protein [Aliarcobacter sp.]|nr:GDSL-type esterase/lipase family protein [Aliarcobacter sp.]
MKNISINMTILIVSIIIMFSIVEGLIRLKNLDMKNYNIEMWKYTKELKIKSNDNDLGFYHKPSSEAILQSVKIRINNYGLRGEDITKERITSRRIIFLGSSATFGWGVNEENTMTSILANKLGNNVEVLNSGVGNYNSVRYVELFFTKLKELNPTDIVVHFFLNDAEDLHVPNTNWFLKNSQLAVLIWNTLNILINQDDDLLNYYYKLYDENYVGYKNMIKSLDRLAKYAKENNIRLYLTLQPDLHYLHDEKLNKYYKKVEEIAISKEFKFLNLQDGFEPSIKSEALWVMPTDAHPNILGHKIMAEEIYPFLKIENK